MSERHDPDDAPDVDDPAVPFQKQTFALTASHRWKAAPGYNILVLDAGAVRLEYPHGWKVIPKSNRLQVHDRPPPDDEGRFQITVFRLPRLAKGESWDGLSLDDLLHKVTTAEPKRRRDRKKFADLPRTKVHDVTSVRRPDLEYAWVEHSGPDPQNGRTIHTRQVLARARGVQPLITFDYYASRAEEYVPVWRHAMNTLRLGSPVNLLGDVSN